MALEELSRVSRAMGIQSNLLCFFLSTRRWVRSFDRPFIAIRVRDGHEYLYDSVYGWTRTTGISVFGR